jgi:hypothetical protein
VPMWLQSERGEGSNGTRFRNFGAFAGRCALRSARDLNNRAIPSLLIDVFGVVVREVETVSRGLRVALRDTAEPLHRRLLLLPAASVR